VIGRPTPLYHIERDDGRMMQVLPGDLVIGAFGRRAATLEGVGDWEAIGDELEFSALTSAGLFGEVTSMSLLLPGTMRLAYVGHVIRAGRKASMKDYVSAAPERVLEAPVILLVGTSMAAGKTTTGRVIIHELKTKRLRVVGAKFTGAGRYRDILAFADAGADRVFDFVDVGLPSTVVPEEEFRPAFRGLVNRIAELSPDVVVAEVGASPLEPYNGSVAIEELRNNVCCTVLAASDPYAVVGVQQAFGLKPDVVTGPATSTSAAIALVRKLTGVEAINVMDPGSLGALRGVLERVLPRGMAKA
jgi:hypothetical protein